MCIRDSFRTAIKEPMDIAFLFWAIAAGIVLAAGLIPLAVVGSLFVGVVLLVFSRQKNGESPYIPVSYTHLDVYKRQTS